MTLRSSLAAAAFLAVLGTLPFAAAQTAAPPSAVPANGSTTAAIMQMQLQAPATGPSRTTGAEADLIYKGYLQHIGHPMVQSKSTSSGTMSSSGTSSGAGQGTGY